MSGVSGVSGACFGITEKKFVIFTLNQEKITRYIYYDLEQCATRATRATESMTQEEVDRTLAWNLDGQDSVSSQGLPPETCRRVGIGWNLTDCYQPRTVWGLPEEMNPESGKPRRVWLSAELVIPTTTGDVVTALKIRRTDWHPDDPFPKYWAVRGGSQSLYVLDSEPGNPVVVGRVGAGRRPDLPGGRGYRDRRRTRNRQGEAR